MTAALYAYLFPTAASPSQFAPPKLLFSSKFSQIPPHFSHLSTRESLFFFSPNVLHQLLHLFLSRMTIVLVV